MLRKAILAACVAFGVIGTAPAHAMSLVSFDAGWYDETGYHNPNNTNIFTSREDDYYNSFTAFDLPNFTDVITAASLVFRRNGESTGNTTGTLSINSVATPVNDLLAGGSGFTNRFTDLGTGPLFGSVGVTMGNSSPMPKITVNLNADALAALQARGGSDFAFGASLVSATGQGFLWGYSGGEGAARLNLAFNGDPLPPPVVPLPAAAWFLLSALGGLAVLRRRGTAAAS